jgi:hypothetical protein
MACKCETEVWCARLGIINRNRNNEIDDTTTSLASSWPASVQTRLWCARLGIINRNRNNEIDDTSTSLASSWPASVKQKYGVQD